MFDITTNIAVDSISAEPTARLKNILVTLLLNRTVVVKYNERTKRVLMCAGTSPYLHNNIHTLVFPHPNRAPIALDSVGAQADLLIEDDPDVRLAFFPVPRRPKPSDVWNTTARLQPFVGVRSLGRLLDLQDLVSTDDVKWPKEAVEYEAWSFGDLVTEQDPSLLLSYAEFMAMMYRDLGM